MRYIELLEADFNWKALPAPWDKYIVSDDGRVYNAETHEEISQWDHTGKGGVVYKRVTLRNAGRKWNARVHRLVALAFIPNPQNKPEVNHIDHNPFNNHVSNLEWVTPQENIRHQLRNQRARRTGRR